jgi:hypothetical protein
MNFKLLEPGDYETYAPYFRNQSYELCIYTLPSMIVWTNSLARHFVAIWQDMLLIYIDFPKGHFPPHLIMPISPERKIEPEALSEICSSADLPTISNVPESYINHFGRKRIAAFFQIEEQPEYEDYVYKTEDLSFLKGNKYAKKRNLINQFKKEYVNQNLVNIEKISNANAQDCLVFLEKWCEEKDCGEKRDKVLACEREAAINAILHNESIGMKGILLRIDGEINAFGMMSALNSDTGVLHFEKAFSRVKGLYQYFDRECARQLFIGYSFINKENDMSIPEIAHAKNSYFPAIKRKSFQLTRLGEHSAFMDQ